MINFYRIFDADTHVIAMGMPAQLGFVAMVAQGMLDRYQNLKVAFLEFGAEHILFSSDYPHGEGPHFGAQFLLSDLENADVRNLAIARKTDKDDGGASLLLRQGPSNAEN